jgi:hypothetical protein
MNQRGTGLPVLRDDQVEWFHQLAALSEGELLAWAGTDYVSDLAEFVRNHVADYSVPERATSRQIVAFVVGLRGNEREWNHALQAALIQAEYVKDTSRSEAKQVLNAFAVNCPWVLFKEVAVNQASWY